MKVLNGKMSLWFFFHWMAASLDLEGLATPHWHRFPNLKVKLRVQLRPFSKLTLHIFSKGVTKGLTFQSCKIEMHKATRSEVNRCCKSNFRGWKYSYSMERCHYWCAWVYRVWIGCEIYTSSLHQTPNFLPISGVDRVWIGCETYYISSLH